MDIFLHASKQKKIHFDSCRMAGAHRRVKASTVVLVSFASVPLALVHGVTPAPTPGGAATVASCDFEEGRCAFTSGNGLPWRLNSGSTTTPGTGPNGDHTTGAGSYAYVEASVPNNPHVGPFLLEAAVSGQGVGAVGFWYSMFGASIGTLHFETSDDGQNWDRRWTQSGNQGPAWQHARVAVFAQNTSHIRFNAITWTDFLGDVAIDDVTVTAFFDLASPAPTASHPPTVTPEPTSATPAPAPTSAGVSTESQLQNAVTIARAVVPLAADIYLDRTIVVRNVSGLSIEAITGNLVSGQNLVQCFFVTAGSNVEFRGLTISECAHSGFGGGILFVYSQGLIVDCIISNSYGLLAGAIYVYGSQVKVVSSLLSGNRADTGGAIVLSYFSSVDMMRSEIVGSQARLYGGVYVRSDCEFFARSTNFSNNVALGGPGGAFFAAGGRTSLLSCVVSLNTAVQSNGGGLYATTSSYISLNNSRIFGNRAASLPFVNITSGSCKASGDCFTSPNYPNPYKNNDKCVIDVLKNATLDLVAFDVQETFDTLTLHGISYSGSDGPFCAKVTAGDQIVFRTDSTTARAGFKICSRTRSDGGGLYLSFGSELHLRDSAVTENEAFSNGGGAFLTSSSTMTIERSSISSNLAEIGSAIYLDQSSISLEHSQILGTSTPAVDTVHIGTGSFKGADLVFSGSFGGEFASAGSVCKSSCTPGKFSMCSVARGTTQCDTNCGQCQDCEAGKFSAKYGSASSEDCEDCATGTASKEGADTCTGCQIGRFASKVDIENDGGQHVQVTRGATQCVACPPATYSNNTFSIVCRVCESGKTSAANSSSCDLCMPGRFSTFSNECPDCLRRAACQDSPGNRLPVPKPGYWMGDTFKEMHRCSRNTCHPKDSDHRCWDIHEVASCDHDELLCSKGAGGPLCGSCLVGYTYSPAFRMCAQCSGGVHVYSMLSLAVLFAILVVGLLVRAQVLLIPTWVSELSFVKIARSIEVCQLRCLVTTYQILASSTWNLDVAYPQLFVDLTESFTWLSLDFIDSKCYSSNTKSQVVVYFILLALPVLIPVGIGVAALIHFASNQRNYDRRSTPKSQRLREEQVLAALYLENILRITYLTLPPVVQKLLQDFDCVFIEGSRRLRIDTITHCDSRAFELRQVASSCYLCVYLSIPFLWFCLLYRQRHVLNPPHVDQSLACYIRNSITDLQPLRFLFAIYTPGSWFSEPLELYRRILFVGVLPLLSADSARRSALGVLFALVSVLYYREAGIFLREETNILAVVCQYSILMVFSAALVIDTGLNNGAIHDTEFGLILCTGVIGLPALAMTFGVKQYIREKNIRRKQLLARATYIEGASTFSENKFKSTFSAVIADFVPLTHCLVFWYGSTQDAKKALMSGIPAQRLDGGDGIIFTLHQPHLRDAADVTAFPVYEVVLACSIRASMLRELPTGSSGFSSPFLFYLPADVLRAVRSSHFSELAEPEPWFRGTLFLPPQQIIRAYQLKEAQAPSVKLSSSGTVAFLQDDVSRRASAPELSSPASCLRYVMSMKALRRTCDDNGWVTLFHYTQAPLRDLICKTGFRMSTQGQGDGGVYFTTMSPASYDVGTARYEENVIADCFGKERLEEYRGKHMLDLCLVYGAEPETLTQAPGGRDNAKMVSKGDFEALSLPDASGNYFLRPDRILACFALGSAATSFTDFATAEAQDLLEGERSRDKATGAFLADVHRAQAARSNRVREAQRLFCNARSASHSQPPLPALPPSPQRGNGAIRPPSTEAAAPAVDSDIEMSLVGASGFKEANPMHQKTAGGKDFDVIHLTVNV